MRHLLGTTPLGEDVAQLCAVATGKMAILSFLSAGATTIVACLIALAMASPRLPLVRSFFRLAGDALDTVGPLLPLSAILVVAPHIGLLPQTVVISMLCWPVIAIPLSSEIVKARSSAHVQAAVMLGAPTVRVVFRHILPEVLIRFIPIALSLFVQLVGLFAALEFIGVTRSSARPLGFLLYESANSFRACPWYFVSCVCAIVGALCIAAAAAAVVQRLFQLPQVRTGSNGSTFNADSTQIAW